MLAVADHPLPKGQGCANEVVHKLVAHAAGLRLAGSNDPQISVRYGKLNGLIAANSRDKQRELSYLTLISVCCMYYLRFMFPFCKQSRSN